MCHVSRVVRSGRVVEVKSLFAPKWRPVEECDGYTVWKNSASAEGEYAVSESWAVYPAADDTEFSCASVRTARARARFLAKCVRERKVPKAAKSKAEKPAKTSKPKGEKKATKTAENLTAAVAKRQAKMAAKRAEKEAARQAAIVEKENRLDAAMAANGGRFTLVG